MTNLLNTLHRSSPLMFPPNSSCACSRACCRSEIGPTCCIRCLHGRGREGLGKQCLVVNVLSFKGRILALTLYHSSSAIARFAMQVHAYHMSQVPIKFSRVLDTGSFLLTELCKSLGNRDEQMSLSSHPSCVAACIRTSMLIPLGAKRSKDAPGRCKTNILKYFFRYLTATALSGTRAVLCTRCQHYKVLLCTWCPKLAVLWDVSK